MKYEKCSNDKLPEGCLIVWVCGCLWRGIRGYEKSHAEWALLVQGALEPLEAWALGNRMPNDCTKHWRNTRSVDRKTWKDMEAQLLADALCVFTLILWLMSSWELPISRVDNGHNVSRFTRILQQPRVNASSFHLPPDVHFNRVSIVPVSSTLAWRRGVKAKAIWRNTLECSVPVGEERSWRTRCMGNSSLIEIGGVNIFLSNGLLSTSPQMQGNDRLNSWSEYHSILLLVVPQY